MYRPLAIALFAACSHSASSSPDSAPTVDTSAHVDAAPLAVITGITWDFSSELVLATGSDLWPTTWGADGNVWTGWGDGGGFGGGNDVDRVSVGMGVIAGMPPEITGTNVWGNTSAGAAQAEHQATFCGKPESEISAGGVLSIWIGSSYNDNAMDNPRCPATPDTPNHVLAQSTDGGASWTEQDWKFTEDAGELTFNNFVEYGEDNAGAPGGYLYLYGFKAGSPGTYLVRVTPSDVTTLASYQVFTGVDGNGAPTWTATYDTSNAADVGTGSTYGVGGTFFHAASGEYITATFATGVGSLQVLTSPNLWGPWTSLESETDWNNYGNTGESLALLFPTKWVSADGKELWGVFSWGDVPGDALHLMKATLSYE